MFPAFPRRTGRLAAVLALSLTTALSAAACGAKEKAPTTPSGVAADKATSAADFGGMDGLVAAAKKEGKLNAIALPPDWANYGEMIDGFEAKYGIKVEVENPDGASQDEINAVKSRKGQDRAPDVLDLGSSFAISGAAAGPARAVQGGRVGQDPRRARRMPSGRWYNDYGGYISIGCDAKRVDKLPADLRRTAQARVQGQGRAQRQPDQVGLGVRRRVRGRARQRRLLRRHPARHGLLRRSSRRPATTTRSSPPRPPSRRARPRSASTGTTSTPATPSEFTAKGVDWKVAVPADGKFSQYYSQAINKDAPHPAAARLWQEYLYSPEGQNLWLKGYARPVLMPAMETDGTLDKAAARRAAEGRGHAAASRPRSRSTRPRTGRRAGPRPGRLTAALTAADDRAPPCPAAAPAAPGPAGARAAPGWLAGALPLLVVRRGRLRPARLRRCWTVRSPSATRRPATATTTANLTALVQGAYLTAPRSAASSCRVIAAALGALLGTLARPGRRHLPVPRRCARPSLTASGVLANFGGVPLAFAFDRDPGQLRRDDQPPGPRRAGWCLYSFWGLAVVYLYFLDAADGAGRRTRAGRAAPAVAGGGGQQRRHHLAVLAARRHARCSARRCSAGSCCCSAARFAAYATAAAMVGSVVPLVTLQIADALSGNVLDRARRTSRSRSASTWSWSPALVMAVYLPLQRRSARWLR